MDSGQPGHLRIHLSRVELRERGFEGLGSPVKGPSPRTKLTKDPGLAAYYEICQMLGHGGMRFWEEDQKVPFLVFTKNESYWYTYDDEKSVGLKAKYVVDKGFGGMFVWSLDFDDFGGVCGPKYPLISAISEKLAST